MEEFDNRIRYSLYSWRIFVEGFSIIVFDFDRMGKINGSLVPKFLFGNYETVLFLPTIGFIFHFI